MATQRSGQAVSAHHLFPGIIRNWNGFGGSELAGLKREKEFLGIADVADLGAGVEGEKLLNMWNNTEQNKTA